MRLENKYFNNSGKRLWYRPLLWTLYSLLIVILIKEFNFHLTIPLAIPSILGTSISLFLGFRTNSAYQRWWEARKIWGEIINNSRTLARQVLIFGNTSTNSVFRKRIINRQIAWSWSLAYSLRKIGWAKEADKYLEKEEINSLKGIDNIPNKILLNHERDLNKMIENNEIDDFYLRKIDSTIKELCDSMGKCERIKSTVFPTQYAFYSLVFINIFLLLLPLGLVETTGYFSIGIHVAIGSTFGMIQNVAETLQTPFENKPSDISMFAISRTIERNLLEMSGEKEIPKPFKSTDGVLM